MSNTEGDRFRVKFGSHNLVVYCVKRFTKIYKNIPSDASSMRELRIRLTWWLCTETMYAVIYQVAAFQIEAKLVVYCFSSSSDIIGSMAICL